jgi:hypothetical protein
LAFFAALREISHSNNGIAPYISARFLGFRAKLHYTAFIHPALFLRTREHAEGLRVWTERQMLPGTKREPELARAARNSANVLLVLSPDYVGHATLPVIQDQSLTPDVLARLRDVLPRCGPFDDDRALRTLFTDRRIAPWAGECPQAGDRD